MTKRNREEWPASPLLANMTKEALDVAWPPPPQKKQQGDRQQQGQEYQTWQIELYDKMRAMGWVPSPRALQGVPGPLHHHS
jgi:hypothetical protein